MGAIRRLAVLGGLAAVGCLHVFPTNPEPDPWGRPERRPVVAAEAERSDDRIPAQEVGPAVPPVTAGPPTAVVPPVKPVALLSPGPASLASGRRPLEPEPPLTMPGESPRGVQDVPRKDMGERKAWFGEASLTWEQASARLIQDHGATHIALGYHNGLWTARCRIPNPANPGQEWAHEAEDADQRAAVRALLAKVNGGR
jgi:hypothetical protein